LNCICDGSPIVSDVRGVYDCKVEIGGPDVLVFRVIVSSFC